MQENTEYAIISSLLFSGTSSAMSMFTMKRDYDKERLIKRVNEAIYSFAYDAVQNLKPDKIKLLSPVIGYIYSAIYMMDIYVADPNITIKGDSTKDRKEYAHRVTKALVSRYPFLRKEYVETTIKNAYVEMKEEYKSGIKYISESIHIMKIVQSPIYYFLFQCHIISKIALLQKQGKIMGGKRGQNTTVGQNTKVGQSKHGQNTKRGQSKHGRVGGGKVSKLDQGGVGKVKVGEPRDSGLTLLSAIPEITGISTDLTYCNFYTKFIKPDNRIELWEYLINYENPQNHVHRLDQYNKPPQFTTTVAFDNTLEIAMTKRQKKLDSHKKVTRFSNHVVNKLKYPFSTSYPINHIYTKSGDIMEWVPVFGKRSDEIAVNNCGVLSQHPPPMTMKPTEPLHESEEDLITARNLKINFKPSPMTKTKLTNPVIIPNSKKKNDFKLDEKNISILSGLLKYTGHLNLVKLLGRTESMTEREIKTAENIKPIDKSCTARVSYYNNMLVKLYCTYVSDPLSAFNAKFTDSAGLTNKLLKIGKGWPVISSGLKDMSYRDTTKFMSKNWTESSTYFWMLDNLLKNMIAVAGVCLPLAEYVFDQILKLEKMRYRRKVNTQYLDDQVDEDIVIGPNDFIIEYDAPKENL
jgi:hypothetical protein